MEIIRARYHINKGLSKPSRVKIYVILMITVLVLSLGGYSFVALSKAPPTLLLSSSDPAPHQPETINLPWLGQGQAAVGSLEDGVLAASSLTEQPKPIASLTKVITALAVLNKSPAATNYTVSKNDVAHYQSYVSKGGSVVPVKEGQVLSRAQVFEALLLASANNLADSLVDWHFTTMQEFMDYANQMVKGYGLTHTVVADASGFSPQTQSTPSDLIVIAQKAMASPEISSIVSLREATIPGSGIIKNTNRLLVEPAVIGIKTGTTDEAGNCLLFASSHSLPSGKKITLLGVVIGAPNASSVFSNSKDLLNSTAANYSEVEVVPSGSEVGTYTSAWGQTSKLITDRPLITETWKGKLIEPVLIMSFAGSFVSAEQVVGEVQLDENNSVNVIAQQTIGLPGNLWKLANYW